MATDGGGISRVVENSDGTVEGFEHFSEDQGLLRNGIMAIEEDQDETLWLSTRHGLSRFDPESGKVANFVEASGLPVSHFNTRASASDDRYVYFGSVEGLLSIEKGSLLIELIATTRFEDHDLTCVIGWFIKIYDVIMTS